MIRIIIGIAIGIVAVYTMPQWTPYVDEAIEKVCNERGSITK
jgi:type II secretory pathway pseudopilin PulG